MTRWRRKTSLRQTTLMTKFFCAGRSAGRSWRGFSKSNGLGLALVLTGCVAFSQPSGQRVVPAPGELSKMWAVPGLPDVDKVDWLKLPLLHGQSSVVFHGMPGDSGHMHHPSICFFDGLYLVSWNDGYNLEN